MSVLACAASMSAPAAADEASHARAMSPDSAASWRMLTAFCAGFPAPQPDGSVVGGLDCDITGGTGRFEGATGEYVFFLVARPRTDGGPGFATEAQISGQISY